MFQKINVGDFVYMRGDMSGDEWTPRRGQVVGLSGDLLEVKVNETYTQRGYLFKSNIVNFIHEDDFFKAQAVRVLLRDSEGWSTRRLLELYYYVISYAPVSHLFWGEFSEMSEGELRSVVKVLEKTSARLVKTA